MAAGNRVPQAMAALALATLLLVLYVPPVARAFEFGTLGGRELAMVLAFGLLSLIGHEAANRAAKLWQRPALKGKA
jgi:hypothetical protein